MIHTSFYTGTVEEKEEHIVYTTATFNRVKRNFKDLVDEFLPIYNEKKTKENSQK